MEQGKSRVCVMEMSYLSGACGWEDESNESVC